MAEAPVDPIESDEPVDGRRLRPPDRRQYEDDLEEINAQIKVKEAEYKALNLQPEESVMAELRDIRSEKEVTMGRRRQIDNDLRCVNQQISKQMETLTKIQANLQYKNEDRINEAIRRLEDQMKYNNFRLREEKKIVAEIDRMRRSKKALGQFTTLKQEIDGLRDRQRRKREERDRLFKAVTSLKTREEELKRKTFSSRSKGEALKNGIDELYECRRQTVGDFKRAEREYFEVRSESRRLQRDELWRKREEEKRQQREEHQKELEEYEASREPFEDEKQLCVMLVTYLQRHLALMDPASVSGGSDTLSDSSPRACELGPVEDTSPNPGPEPAKELETEGMYVLRKKDEDLFGGISRHKPNKRSKRDKRKSVNKPIVHTPEIFTQFALLNLCAPSSVTEIPGSIDQLFSKKAYYDSLPTPVKPTIQIGSASQESPSEGSIGAPSYTESTMSESIPSTPEVASDNPPVWPRRKLSRDSGLCELEGHEDSGSAGEEGSLIPLPAVSLLPLPQPQTTAHPPALTLKLMPSDPQGQSSPTLTPRSADPHRTGQSRIVVGSDNVIEDVHEPEVREVLRSSCLQDRERLPPATGFYLNSSLAEEQNTTHTNTDRLEEFVIS